jgi:hypothetical protein
MYQCTREFYSKSTIVYKSGGTVFQSNSAGTGAKYNGFDAEGNFYVITKSGELKCSDTSGKVTTLLASGAISLSYDCDDLAYIVRTTVGNKYLDGLTSAPDIDYDINDPLPTENKSAERVEIYTNSANEQVSDCYKNNKKIMSIIVSSNGSKILNDTANVRLSDTLKGAKFLGVDSSYNVYCYEVSGVLYRFKYGAWYSAEKLSLTGNFKSYKLDDNGFISKVVTTKASYTVKQLTTSSKWKASKTYVVSKSNYATMYVKGSTKSYTLLLSNGTLTLNGKKVATNVSKYGFVTAKKIAYIKNGTVYTASVGKPTKSTKICTKAKSFKATSVGLLNKVVLSSGKTKKLS